MKKKNDKVKPVNFIIPLVVYPFELMVSIEETEEAFKKNLEAFGPEYNPSLALISPERGRAMLFSCNRSLIRLEKRPRTPREHGILAHEIFHIVDFYMNRIGMKLKRSSFEAYAYLLGYITEEIYKRIK